MKVIFCLAATLLAVVPSLTHADTPCTGCVVWETRGAQVDAVLASDGSLRGLALLVAPAGAAIDPEPLKALRARGADVGLVHEIDGEPAEPSADVLRRMSRLLIRSTVAPDPKATAFAIRRLATRARALHPSIEVGVEANPEIVAAVTPYVDFAIAQAGEPRLQGLPVWEKGRTLRVLDPADVAAAAAAAAASADAVPASPGAPEAAVPRFSSDVEVVARRTLSVEEVIARHQAAAVRQGERIASWVGSGSTIIAFQAPGLAAPMTITAGTVVFVGPGLHEVEQREVRLNGVAVPIGRDAVPRLPIIEPERVSAAPLALVLDERYRYRLEKPEAVDGHPSYVVVFEPAASGTALMSGRAWISAEDFGLVRMDAEQTGLLGPIVSSRQRDEYRALDVDGERAWVLRRSETHQSYEGPGHRTPIHRVMMLDTYEANPPDFAARRDAAHRSSSVLLALTDEGFRYLRREPARAALTPGEAQTEQPALRTIAGRSTRIWTAAAGLLIDPNISDPLPFAGLGYFDLDFLGTGSQLNAFAAGPFLSLAWSAPSLGGGRTIVQVRGFASLVEYNDRSFRDGLERYDENVRQQPAFAAIDLVRPFGIGWRVRASYEIARPGLRRGPDTAPAFQAPASPIVHAARLALEGEVARWTLSAWASAARRNTWRDWGFAGNPESSPEARAYERAGAGAARSFVLGPRVAARVDVAAMAGRGLDRFSRFTFDGLENRLHGSPSATVRFDRGVVWRSALSATATRAVRGDLFLDLAVVHDPAQGAGHRAFPGFGAAAELRLPWSTLLSAEWGYGPEARDREGRRGAHVIRITAYKIL